MTFEIFYELYRKARFQLHSSQLSKEKGKLREAYEIKQDILWSPMTPELNMMLSLLERENERLSQRVQLLTEKVSYYSKKE
jgi:hypothetical protein